MNKEARARPSRAAVAAPAKADADSKRQKAEERKRAARLSDLEKAIAALEQRLARLSGDLEDAGGDVTAYARLARNMHWSSQS